MLFLIVVLGILPCSCPVLGIWLAIVEKKYLTGVLSSLLLISTIIFLTKILTEDQKLTKLQQKIEYAFSKIDAQDGLTIDFLDLLVKPELKKVIDFNIVEKNTSLKENYDILLEAYEKKMAGPVTDKEKPGYKTEELNLAHIYSSKVRIFCYDYIDHIPPTKRFYDINATLFLILSVICGILNPYLYIKEETKKRRARQSLYVNQSPVNNSTSAPNSKPSSPPVKEESQKKITEIIKINETTEKEIVKHLSLTSLQSKFIVQEREKNGPYTNADDFTKRSNLPDRIIQRIIENLDFSHIPPENPKGRVIDF